MNKQHNDVAHYDVLIIGAGLSGIGTACRIADSCPDKSMAILERRNCIGGTWDLFKYPGIRSDSDMCSFSYKFRPWRNKKVLADGHEIKQYIADTAEQYGVKDKIHYGLKISRANWSSEKRRWHVTATSVDSGEIREYSCNYLVACTGYYDHETGFWPEFEGEENFKGTTIHPQFWPEDLNYTGKKVIVIGSGATAITLAPSMADKAGHITMLQRSPTYIFSLPAVDKLTALLARIVPNSWAYGLARKRNIWLQRLAFLACRRWPKLARRMLLSKVRKQVGPDVDMRHFTPSYMPWDERLCVVPNGDLFQSIREGKINVETDHIDRFTENGIRLKSGKELEADIIVAATGLKLQILGGVEVSVDGVPRPLNGQMTYKGVLVENLPNMAWIFGYTNASWTLKIDIAARYLCRLFKHMDERRLEVVTPHDGEANVMDEGILDSLQAGYVKRFGSQLPRQGRDYPWHVHMHYGRDRKMLLKDSVVDKRLQFLPTDQPATDKNPPRTNRSSWSLKNLG